MAEAALAPLKRVAPDAIRLERLLDAPVETVWRFLSEAELRRNWFMVGTDARPGGEFELVVDHDNLSDEKDVPYPEGYAQFKGTVWRDKVLRFDPPRLLETTFQGGRNGTVTYELFAEGERTRLVLTHSGIVSPVGAQDFGSGWNSHLKVLEERLAGRTVANVCALHARSREVDDSALESGHLPVIGSQAAKNGCSSGLTSSKPRRR
jgi:uncharacterized protein YndB with AHSA1/START domain